MPTRRHIRFVLAVLAAAAVLAPAQQAFAGGLEIRQVDTGAYPTIRVLVVAPTTAAAAPTLMEDGAPAAGFTAQNLAGRESIALVIDNSQSMRGHPLADAIRAARAFVAASPGSDQIGMIAVGSQAVALARYSPGGIDVDPVLQQLSIDSRYGTVLWDALVLAANGLRRHSLAGRVIVLVTDGQNTTSKATVNDAIRAARAAQVAIYTVGIPDKWFTPRPLEQLAAATGGRYYHAPTTAALPSIYRSIGAELKRTWRLDFETAARPGERLKLEAQSAGARTTATITLSKQLAAKPAGNSQLILFTFALVLAAGLAVAVVATLRSTTIHHRWQREPPDF